MRTCIKYSIKSWEVSLYISIYINPNW